MNFGGHLCPRYRLLHANGRIVSSFSWLWFAWDAIWVHRKYVYIQSGQKPKQFFFLSRDGEYPVFLFSVAYKTYFRWHGIRAGLVSKPMDFELVWGRYGDGKTRTRSGVEQGPRRMDVQLDLRRRQWDAGVRLARDTGYVRGFHH